DLGAPASRQRVQRPPADLGLDAAAAEGAGLRAVVVDDHRGTGLLRSRAARLHDQAPGAGPAAVQGGGQFGEQLAHSVLGFQSSPLAPREGSGPHTASTLFGSRQPCLPLAEREGYIRHADYAFFTPFGASGSDRNRTPVAWKIAVPIAGATAMIGVSPAPA